MNQPLYTAAPSVFRARDFLVVMLAGLFFVIIQNTVTPWLGLSGYGPEWVLILAVYICLRAELWQAALAAFILGFFRDAVGGGFPGLHQFSLTLIIWLFARFRGRLNFWNPLALMPLLFGLNLVNTLLLAAPIMNLLGWRLRGFNPAPLFVASSVTTALAAVPLFYILAVLTRSREKS